MSLLDWLRPTRPAHGEPITLEFKCGDTITNQRPPLLRDEDRQEALRQARDTHCPVCRPALWRGLAVDGGLPQMRVALTDAWRRP